MSKNRYSEPIMDELVELMDRFLQDHDFWQLMELVADAIAKKEQQ